jgi:diguanylate cyclase (GGDEF)-like protein/PAS domain S-box-containing protein
MTMVAPTQSYDRASLVRSQRVASAAASSLWRELEMLAIHDKALFGFMMEVSFDGIWMWDLKTPGQAWVSPRFWELLGYGPERTLHASADWSGLLHPDMGKDVVARFVAYCAQPDHLYDEVLQYRHRDGTPVWLRCRGAAVRDANGRPDKLLCAHTDVTALKRTEADLLRGQAELEALLAESSQANEWLEMAEQVGRVGHWRRNLRDQSVVWSNEMYRMHGVTRESFTLNKESSTAFVHPDDREMVIAITAKAIETASPFEFSARLILGDGDVRHIIGRGVVRLNADGQAGIIVGVSVDITEQRQMDQALREANARLEALVNVDSLTLLANRRRFDEALMYEWRRAAREGTSLSLVLLDLDRFKGFNDRYGHLAGDDCLRCVASVLAAQGRRSADLAARYGGEEMVLLLPSTTTAGAETVARDCRSAIAALGIRHEGNMNCGGVVTASFGVATATPAEDSAFADWTGLIAEADRQLYEAKRTGRNKVMTQAIAAAAGAAPLAIDEEARLVAVCRYEKAGATHRTQEMDGIARLAATLTGAPVAMVSYITRDQKRLMGKFNLPGADSMPREISLCTHTILGDEPMVVADAAYDLRFRESPVVTGALGLRYYAGAPIVSQSTGHKLGTLCVIDTVPHEQTGQAERAILTDLAGMVAALMEDSLKSNDNKKA